jgi:hypothetical protein
VLLGDLAIHQLPHLRVGAEFSVPARVMRIVDAADSDRADLPLLGDRISTAAEPGVMNGTNLGATKPHVGCSFGCRLLKRKSLRMTVVEPVNLMRYGAWTQWRTTA